jgi:hypothetical protein
MRRHALNTTTPDTWGHAEVVAAAGALLDDLWQDRDPQQLLVSTSSVTANNLPPHAAPLKKQADHFEGLARTLLLAGPALSADPSCMQRDVRSVYRQLVVQAADPKHRLTVLGPEKTLPPTPIQQQVEGAALVIALQLGRSWLWEPMSRREQDAVLTLIERLAYRQTYPHNWRWFQVLMISFLAQEGCAVDLDILDDHLLNLDRFAVRDGWYRDGTAFDRYAGWTFQTYAPLWCSWFGDQHRPAIAQRWRRQYATFIENYIHTVSAHGEPIAWGRSACYQAAALAPFAAGAWHDQVADLAPLALRTRLCRGVAGWLQDDRRWLPQGTLGLGPLGDFAPSVQNYSCPLSPWWASKAFLALAQGPLHLFWHQAEQPPELLVAPRYLAGPGLVLRQRPLGGNNAEQPTEAVALPQVANRAELVPCKVRPRHQAGDPDYLRLWYDSQLPWAAGDAETGMFPGGLGLLLDGDATWQQPQARVSGGMHGQVVYSRFLFAHENAVDCALIPVDHGWLVALLPQVNDGGQLQVGSLALPQSAAVGDHSDHVREQKHDDANVNQHNDDDELALEVAPWHEDGIMLRGVGVNGTAESLGVRLLAGEELGAVAVPAHQHPLHVTAGFALASYSWQRYSNPGPMAFYIANDLRDVEVSAALDDDDHLRLHVHYNPKHDPQQESPRASDTYVIDWRHASSATAD